MRKREKKCSMFNLRQYRFSSFDVEELFMEFLEFLFWQKSCLFNFDRSPIVAVASSERKSQKNEIRCCCYFVFCPFFFQNILTREEKNSSKTERKRELRIKKTKKKKFSTSSLSCTANISAATFTIYSSLIFSSFFFLLLSFRFSFIHSPILLIWFAVPVWPPL